MSAVPRRPWGTLPACRGPSSQWLTGAEDRPDDRRRGRHRRARRRAAILGRGRATVAGGLAALAVAELLLARHLLPDGLGSTLASGAGAAAIGVGLPALAGLAALFVRYPAIVPPVVVAAAPFRFPFEFGADNRLFVGIAEDGALGRLLPLYGVVAAAGIALVWRLARGEEPAPLPRSWACPPPS